MNNKIFPVAIFAYNRPDHLKNLLDSLEANELSKETDVYIFINKFEDDDVHSSILEISEEDRHFKSKKVHVNPENLGIKGNLMTGINKVFESHSAVIVLEDDLELDLFYLDFMNKSLNKYADDENIYHVNGWSYPQITKRKKVNLVGKLALGWGWGTWKNTWEKFNQNYHDTDFINNGDVKDIKRFNFYNLSNFSRQLVMHTTKEIEGLDVFWYQFIFLNKGLTIFPGYSLVKNSGFDGSGVHCGISKDYDNKIYDIPIKTFSDKTDVDLLNEISTYVFYFKIKIKDYVSYHSKKLVSVFESN